MSFDINKDILVMAGIAILLFGGALYKAGIAHGETTAFVGIAVLVWTFASTLRQPDWD